MSTPSWPAPEGSGQQPAGGMPDPAVPSDPGFSAAGYPAPDYSAPGAPAAGYPAPTNPTPDYSAPDYSAPGAPAEGYPVPDQAATHPQGAGAFPAPDGYAPPAGAAYAPPPPGAPGFPAAAAVPAAAKAKRPRWLIAAILAVVLIGAGIFSFVHNKKTDTTEASVGSCIQVKSISGDKPDTSQISCSDPKAVFVVTQTGGSGITCDDNEAQFSEGKDTSDPSTIVCMRPNLKVGECWYAPDETTPPTKPACATAPSESMKLLALVTTSSDASACPQGTLVPLSLTTRNMIYCFANPQ